jgi:hypothetical protein
VREGSRKYSKCHLNVLALADLPILPQRASSQEIDSLLPHRMVMWRFPDAGRHKHSATDAAGVWKPPRDESAGRGTY